MSIAELPAISTSRAHELIEACNVGVSRRANRDNGRDAHDVEAEFMDLGHA